MSEARSVFDDHWTRHAAAGIPAPKLALAAAFLAPLVRELATRPDARVLDIGCGDGVHAAVLAESGRASGYVGIDVSASALPLARPHLPAGGTVAAADTRALPFPDGTFDAAFAFGTLEYLPDPATAFAEVARVLGQGGMLGVWMLPAPAGVTKATLAALRVLARGRSGWVAARLADLVVPVLGLVPSRTRLNLINASWAQCREALMVNIAPPNLTFLPRDEIVSALSRAGFAIEIEDVDAPITLWARKAPA